MKKLFNVALLIGAVSALMCSCEQEPKTDGKAEFASFTITAEANPALELTRDYKAIINNTEGTILVALPEGTDVTALVPTFTLTKDDAASVDGVAVVSGEWTLDLTEAVVAKVEDAMSMVSKEYTITAAYTDGIAELTKVGFYAASNEGKLTTDVEPISIASTMTVAFPGDANQTFVLTVEATMDDVVTVNGVEATLQEPEVAEGEAAPTAFVWTAEADCSFPIDIVVADAKAGVENKYVIKIVKDTYGESWTQMASIAKLPSQDYAFDVDPVTGDLYIAFAEATMKDGETKAVNRITVQKWDGSKFVTVGEPAFSPAKASYFAVAARAGKVYVMYVDGGVSSKQTIQMWNGSTWTMIGAQGEMGKVTGTSRERNFLAIDPISGKLFASCCTSEDYTDYGVNKQCLHLGMWDGSAWIHSGSVSDRSATMLSLRNVVYAASDAVYLLTCNQKPENTNSIYRYSNGAWTTLVAGYKMKPDVTEIGSVAGLMRVNSKGELHSALFEQTSAGWNVQIFKQVGNTLERVYSPIQEGTSAPFGFEFDENDLPILAYKSDKNDHLKLVTIDPETQAWTYPADLGFEPYSSYPVMSRKSSTGDIYVSALKQNVDPDPNDATKTVKTYEVVLYKKVK
ncbi:MAG: hypothetical protein IKU97_01725 [Tidjanibacter sp.]|nr:hypothetical protein [Tidjanibacter sp.]